MWSINLKGNVRHSNIISIYNSFLSGSWILSAFLHNWTIIIEEICIVEVMSLMIKEIKSYDDFYESRKSLDYFIQYKFMINIYDINLSLVDLLIFIS